MHVRPGGTHKLMEHTPVVVGGPKGADSYVHVHNWLFFQLNEGFSSKISQIFKKMRASHDFS